MAEYIDREAVLGAMIAAYNCDDIDISWCTDVESVAETIYCAMKEVVYATPTADVAPVEHGRWVEDGDGTHFCSECKSPANYDSVEWDYRGKKREDLTNYCYSCGAKMDGGAENDL